MYTRPIPLIYFRSDVILGYVQRYPFTALPRHPLPETPYQCAAQLIADA